VAQITLSEIASSVNGRIIGDENHLISNVATLANANSSEISFLANTKYKKYLSDTNAGCVLVDEDSSQSVTGNAIVVKDPYLAYAKVATLLFPEQVFEYQVSAASTVADDSKLSSRVHISPNCVVESGVEIADDVYIGPGCVIGPNVKIGSGTRLKANVTISSDVVIGERVIIHPGVVIGADGFGLANDKGQWLKIPQVGTVQIGNDVEVGANTTIDRGAIDDTIISDGVKLDNQIQIAHNVIIGKNTVIAGCTGIAGSTHIGANCAIGGGCCITGHVTITDGVQLMGMSMVTKSINEPGIYASGIPTEPVKQWHKNVARFRRSAEFVDRLNKLEKQVD
jgi:UDP-3-O-[3-hydroxymyristoyl] glucosamine N-acyltransferase